jgi:hypothetical protein
MAARRRKNGSLDGWGQLVSLQRRAGLFLRFCRRALETFRPCPEAGLCPRGPPRAGQGARIPRRIDGNRQLRMEARKLPTLCGKFEQWYFVPQYIFSHYRSNEVPSTSCHCTLRVLAEWVACRSRFSSVCNRSRSCCKASVSLSV